MSEFVAGAFVDVKADTKGFREDLRRKVNASINSMGTFKIPVELDPKRFKSTVNAAAKSSPAKIPIVPGTSVAELRKSIQDKITRATTGMKIVVPVEVVGGAATTGTTGAAAGATAGAGKAAATKTAATGATKKLTEAEQAEIAVTRALKKSQDELAVATELITLANVQGVTAEERKLRLGEARAATTRSAAAANRVLAISEKQLAIAQSEALATAREEALILRGAVTEKQQELAVNTATATVETKSAAAREAAVAAMTVEVKEITTLNALHTEENALLAVEARLKAQTNRARELGVSATVAENEAIAAQIAERKLLISSQRDFLKGESASARTQKTAARGFAATFLSLLGIRGATLAASSAFLVGAVSAAVFAKSVKSFADFETELNVFQATAGATAEQMKAVAEEAAKLGADISLPGVTAASAAEAMTELARAGLSVRDSIAGARGVLQLSAAAQISIADATTLAASALNAFGLEGAEAAHVADLLANAANASQGSISEMGAAMQQAAAIARQVGLSLDDTVAILTQFARNGLRGSDAGTSLRTALSRLIAPTKKASDLIEALGLNLRDANGNIRADVFAQFGQATQNLTPALRDMIAETIAGQDAIRAFSIGAREGARGLKLAQLQMAATGSAAQLAAARSKGLAGSFSALGSNVQTLGTQLGKFASGPVSATVKGLNLIFTGLNQLASGDFGDLLGGKSDDQAVANLERKGKALLNILNPLEKNRFTQIGKLFTPAPDVDKTTSKIKELQEAVTRLQNLRVQTFQVGGDIGPITGQIKDLRRQLTELKADAGLIIPVTPLEKALAPLEEAKKTAKDLRDEILRTGGSRQRVQFLDDLIRNFDVRMKLIKQNAKSAVKDVENTVTKSDIGKSFNATFGLIADNIDLATPEVLGSLDDLVRKMKGKGKLSGEAGQAIGKSLLANINTAITAAVEDDNPELAAALKKLATKIAALFGGSLGEAFKGIKVPLTDQELEDALLPAKIKTARAQAFGTVSDQIAGKTGELDKLNKQLGQVVKGSAQEEKVLNDISSAKGDIRSLRESQASKQKEADDKSDKKITDTLSKEERGLSQNLTVAQATETLKDDIKAQRALHAFYIRQIATIKATVKDADNRNSAVADAEDNLFKSEQDLAAAQRGRRDQIREARLKPIDDAIDRASETETLKDDLARARQKVRFWRKQVKNIKDLVKDRRATGEELKAANDALDEAEKNARQVRKDRRLQITDFKQQGLELDIEFAQTTENEAKEIRARNAYIRFLERQKKHFRGNVNKLKELRNEIANQKKAIKDLKDDTDESKGTTVFELLKQAADVFRENAGNAITPNQPFAGPTGFVSQIANFIRRQDLKNKKGALDGAKLPKGNAAGSGPTQPGGLSELALDATRNITALGTAADRTATKVKRLFTVGDPHGLLKAGNIDILHRPSVKNPAGGRSTVFSETIGVGDKQHPGLTAVIPRVLGNTPSTKGQKARIVSPEEAKRHFQETGENLGIFSSLKDAEIYSELLHQQQAKLGLRKTQGVNPLTGAPMDAGATTAVDRNRVSVERLTTSVDRLANVLDRQPGTGKGGVSKKPPAGIERSERNHFSVATASRRIVENRGSL